MDLTRYTVAELRNLKLQIDGELLRRRQSNPNALFNYPVIVVGNGLMWRDLRTVWRRADGSHYVKDRDGQRFNLGYTAPFVVTDNTDPDFAERKKTAHERHEAKLRARGRW